ncbi:MAG: DNA-processing protein DprA [Bacteroidota bacterium]
MRKIPRISDQIIHSITNKEILLNAEREVSFIQRYKIAPLFFKDEVYPRRLKNCLDSPVMLYYKGNAEVNVAKVLSIVGTRSATEYGRSICDKFIHELAGQGLLIVSGLAHGIDSCAHRKALEAGLNTIGILGHGLDRINPWQNKGLAEKMISQGGLLTDFPSRTKPDRENFPRRNRLIAGISDAVLIVEAAAKGGALITADIANSYNRDVFAVPGRVGDPYSEGTNMVIRQNKAALVQSADDIIYLLGWKEREKVSPPQQRKIFLEMTWEEEKLVEILNREGELSIDDLMISSGISMSKCSVALLNLEFENIVRSLPGKSYKLI